MKQISTYRVALFNRAIRYQNNAPRVWTTAQIRVDYTDGKQSYLIFYDPAKTEGSPEHVPGDGPLLFYPHQQYAAHLDLLRNEDPILMQDDAADWRLGSMRTGREDVGDGE